MIDELCRLTDEDLRQLAAALRSGRLSPPFSGIVLGRTLSLPLGEVIAQGLQRLADEGLRPEHMARAIEVLRLDRAPRPPPEDAIELVWTGPEVAGITNRDTSAVVRDLFSVARHRVMVAGYAIYQGHFVVHARAGRMDQDSALRVTIYLDVRGRSSDVTAPSEVLADFSHRSRTYQWPGRRLPEVFFDPRSLEMESTKRSRLHAKCIVVDTETAFVSSANFTEADQVRNIEAGVLIHSRVFAERLSLHFESLASVPAALRVGT
ncbi:MAG TPA: DISARM system phospholipase D-like protein DrmC [Isosphaeraceae bacterium]|jgi:phosphatidylserine/phosphatidylglycerophosphate/cardiolipin synthase-like enzyme